jgi:hypothetical protein
MALSICGPGVGRRHNPADARLFAKIDIESSATMTAGGIGVIRLAGGTGRFEGVSGSADFVVTINPLTGGFELIVGGRINF